MLIQELPGRRNTTSTWRRNRIRLLSQSMRNGDTWRLHERRRREKGCGECKAGAGFRAILIYKGKI